MHFDTPRELANYLYDEAVEPGDSMPVRVRLAHEASKFALEKFGVSRGE